MPDYKSFQVYSKPPDPQKELAWLSDMQARSRAAGGWSEYGAGEFVVTRCAIPLPYAVLGDSRWTQINAGESVVIIREAEPRGRLSEPPTYICEYRGIEINIRADRLSPAPDSRLPTPMLQHIPFCADNYRPRVSTRRARPLATIPALAALMLQEMECRHLIVVLIPDQQYCGYGNEFRRLRAAEEQNAAWYQEFCGRYESRRRFRGRRFKTLIKRRETLNALRKIAAGRADQTPYCERLVEMIEEIRYVRSELKALGLWRIDN